MKQNIEAFHTYREILQQPSVWSETLKIVQNHRDLLWKELRAQVGETFDVVFMGAGTSEYIGNALVPALSNHSSMFVRSVATTEMISSPFLYLRPQNPTLCVSFGRSGNSPESLGALQAVESCHPAAYHLIITCNDQGGLANYTSNKERLFKVILPSKTHDLGFAMTSSFTSMMLSAYLLLVNNPKLDEEVAKLCDKSRNTLRLLEEMAVSHTSLNLQRLVVLGSHALKGFAQESQLKMLELSSGRVATLFDSPLGFRHGPKSFINENTLTVVYLSPDPDVKRYELDLVEELKYQGRSRLCVIEPSLVLNDLIENNDRSEQNIILTGLSLMPFAQFLAFHQSLILGINPDNPSPRGEVNRVVSGVKIYPAKAKE